MSLEWVNLILLSQCCITDCLSAVIFDLPVNESNYWKQWFFFCWWNFTENLTFTFSKSTTKTLKRCEICSKLTIKTPERRQWLCSVFIVNFEIISDLFLLFLLLTLSMHLTCDCSLTSAKISVQYLKRHHDRMTFILVLCTHQSNFNRTEIF